MATDRQDLVRQRNGLGELPLLLQVRDLLLHRLDFLGVVLLQDALPGRKLGLRTNLFLLGFRCLGRGRWRRCPQGRSSEPGGREPEDQRTGAASIMEHDAPLEETSFFLIFPGRAPF